MEKAVSERFDRIENLIVGLATTVEDLAAATAKSFVTVAEKFEEIDIKLDKLDRKIDTVEENLTGKIHGVQRALDSEFERQSSLEARVSKVETELHIL